MTSHTACPIGKPYLWNSPPVELVSFFAPSSRELLRVRPNPLTSEEVRRLRGLRPAGPPPRPGIEPARVQRRVSAVGTVMVCRQAVSLGRPYAGQTVPVHVADSTITVDLDGQVRVIRRATDVPVRNVKANKPREVSDVVQAHRQASPGTGTSSISWDPTLWLRSVSCPG
jgi:hypothetical protein